LKEPLAALLLLCALAVQPHAQGEPATERARKLDSFGEIQYSDLMARLDNLAVQLYNEPWSRGVIAAYGAKHKFPGWPLRRARDAFNYLVETRGIDRARLSVVNGGLRGETTHELWLVPPGAAPPVEPFDVSLLMAGDRSPLLFDRFVVVERGDDIVSIYGLEPSPDSADPYTYFAEALRRDPSLRGLVVGYTWRRGKATAARRIAARAKTTIAKAHAVDVSRVVAVGGGRRDYKTLELWLVPPGAALPGPTPAPRPGQRRRRPR
jgi:hypothetical protein